MHICEDLKELIFVLEEKCTPSNESLQIYYHELLILNNNVLVTHQAKKSLFVPYTMLGYFITDDKHTCSNTLEFFKGQMNNSVLINQAGLRDKKKFFNKLYQKIEFYKNQIVSFPAQL